MDSFVYECSEVPAFIIEFFHSFLRRKIHLYRIKLSFLKCIEIIHHFFQSMQLRSSCLYSCLHLLVPFILVLYSLHHLPNQLLVLPSVISPHFLAQETESFVPGHCDILSFRNSYGWGPHQIGECSCGKKQRVVNFTENTDSLGGLFEVIVVRKKLWMLFAKGHVKSLHWFSK